MPLMHTVAPGRGTWRARGSSSCSCVLLSTAVEARLTHVLHVLNVKQLPLQTVSHPNAQNAIA